MVKQYYVSALQIINLLCMNEYKFRTIDPLILETLNLNQKRMNHILEILHGKDTSNAIKTQRKPIVSHHLSSDRSMSMLSQNELTLPSILQSHKRMKNQKISHQSTKSIQKSRFKDHSSLQQEGFNASMAVPSRKLRNQKQIKQSDPQELQNEEQAPTSIQKMKNKMLIKDYMLAQVRRAKSQQLKPRDMYRLEMQSIISELTQIQNLQDADKRMKRIKKRYQHLRTFDKNYYSKLNQDDLMLLD